MKLQVLSHDEVLIANLKKTKLFHEVSMLSSIEKVDGDYLLISDSLIDYQELSTLQCKSQIE
ncbi:hypothetical protein B5V91_15095, partial [Heyndrickxia sporothermodurans]